MTLEVTGMIQTLSSQSFQTSKFAIIQPRAFNIIFMKNKNNYHPLCGNYFNGYRNKIYVTQQKDTKQQLCYHL